MAEKTLVPEAFGPLQGVKIVSSGTLIAEPFAAALAADMGAEVIQVERPGVGDLGWRTVGIRLNWVRRPSLPDVASAEYRRLFGEHGRRGRFREY